MISQFVAYADEKEREWLAGEIRESFAPESAGRYIRIFREGKVIYQSGNMQIRGMGALPSPSSDLLHKTEFFQRVETEIRRTYFVLHQPLGLALRNSLCCADGSQTEQIDRILRSLLIALSILTPLILGGIAVGGYLLMNVPLRPWLLRARRSRSHTCPR